MLSTQFAKNIKLESRQRRSTNLHIAPNFPFQEFLETKHFFLQFVLTKSVIKLTIDTNTRPAVLVTSVSLSLPCKEMVKIFGPADTLQNVNLLVLFDK